MAVPPDFLFNFLKDPSRRDLLENFCLISQGIQWNAVAHERCAFTALDLAAAKQLRTVENKSTMQQISLENSMRW